MEKIKEEMGEYLSYCEKTRRMSETTLKAKRGVLGRFARVSGAWSVAGVTNADFDKWMAYLTSREVSAGAVNTYNATVIAFVRYFQDIGVSVKLNLKLISKLKGVRRARKSYTEEEISLVVSSAFSRGDFETGLLILVMAETGMRIAELVRLSTSEISGTRIVFIGKGMKKREVYISTSTAGRLSGFLGGREGYVWGGSSLNGEPPCVNTVRSRMALAFSLVGFQGFYPHALRHSFATNLQRKGASVAEIKEMMGHSSVATTERYLHEFEGRMEELFLKYR